MQPVANPPSNSTPVQVSVPSTFRWFILHIFVPLVPFIIGGVVRYASFTSFKLNTLNCAELCLSMGVISIFMFQNLWEYEDPLPNKDKKEEVKVAAVISIILGFILVVIYAIIESLNTIVNERCIIELNDSLQLTQYIGFVFSFICTLSFLGMQKAFKLKAKF